MKIFEKKIALTAVFLMSSVSLGVQAAAWKTCNGVPQTWSGDDTTMFISTTSMPIGSTWDLRTQYMMSEWNGVGKSNFRFYINRDTNGSTNTSNGRNEIDFKYKPNESYLGVTSSRYQCYWLFGWKRGIKESDIHLNTRYSWTSGDFTGSTTGSPYNFELVMLHELGHSLGLMHSNGRPNTMNTYYYNGGPTGHYAQVEPHSDDRYGLRVLYPDSSTDRDISASRFRNTGGGSSTTNKVYSTGGSWRTSLGRGQQYDMKYTMENLGTQNESVNVKFYISTNSYISTGDRYVGSSTWNMPSGTYVTANKRFTVPSNLSPGTYYVGYKVDPNNSISESNEGNNFVSLLHAITIY